MNWEKESESVLENYGERQQELSQNGRGFVGREAKKLELYDLEKKCCHL